MHGRPIATEDVQNLATLPPVDVLRGQVLGAITAPLMTIVGLFTAPLRDLIGLIHARIDQLGRGRRAGRGARCRAGRERRKPADESVAAEPGAEEPVAEATPTTEPTTRRGRPSSRRREEE